jgi:hypothetical protein
VVLLDGGNMLGDRRARHAEILRSGREARTLSHTREDSHHLQGVHAAILPLFLAAK